MDDTLVAVDYCDRHPTARATYIAFKVNPSTDDDLDSLLLTLCDHCTHKLVDQLVVVGFSLQLIPGVRTAATHG